MKKLMDLEIEPKVFRKRYSLLGNKFLFLLPLLFLLIYFIILLFMNDDVFKDKMNELRLIGIAAFIFVLIIVFLIHSSKNKKFLQKTKRLADDLEVDLMMKNRSIYECFIRERRRVLSLKYGIYAYELMEQISQNLRFLIENDEAVQIKDYCHNISFDKTIVVETCILTLEGDFLIIKKQPELAMQLISNMDISEIKKSSYKYAIVSNEKSFFISEELALAACQIWFNQEKIDQNQMEIYGKKIAEDIVKVHNHLMAMKSA